MKIYEKEHTMLCPKCKQFGATILIKYDDTYGFQEKLISCKCQKSTNTYTGNNQNQKTIFN